MTALCICCVCTSTTLAQEFSVFNYWYPGVPGPTFINRAYIDSATSAGMADNVIPDIFAGYTQRTIFEVCVS